MYHSKTAPECKTLKDDHIQNKEQDTHKREVIFSVPLRFTDSDYPFIIFKL